MLVIRALLGLFFAYLLARFFFPAAGIAKIILMAVALVFFAYVFEAIRRPEK
jgi:hypothetical protein